MGTTPLGQLHQQLPFSEGTKAVRCEVKPSETSKNKQEKDLRVYAKQPEKLHFESASHIVLFGHKTLHKMRNALNPLN